MAEIPIGQRNIATPQAQKNIRVPVRKRAPILEASTKNAITGLASGIDKSRNAAIDKADDLAGVNYENDIERAKIIRQTSIAEAQGENVFSANDEAQEGYRNDLEEIRAKYPERYHASFKVKGDSSANDLMKFGLMRQVREGTKLADKAFDTNKGFGIGKVVFSANNPVEFENNILKLASTVRKHGDIKYGHEENGAAIVEEEARIVVSRSITETVSQYSSGGDVDNAKRINEGWGSALTAEDKEKVNKLLKAAEDNNLIDRANNLVNAAFLKHGDDSKAAYKMIQKAGKKDGKLFRQASLLFRAQDKFREDIKGREQDKQVNGIVKNIQIGSFPTSGQLANLDGKNKKWVQQYMKDTVDNKYKLKSNPKVLNEALDLMRDKPDDFISNEVDRYKPSLRADHFAFLKKNWERMTNERRSDKKTMETSTVKVVDDLVSQIAVKRGLYKDDPEYADLRGFSMQIHDRVKAENPNELNQKVIRRKVYAEMLKLTKPTERTGFNKFVEDYTPFSFDKDPSEDPSHFDNFDPDAPAPEATFIDTVDSYWVDTIKKSFIRKNKPVPTGEALERLLKGIQSKGHDITKPRK